MSSLWLKIQYFSSSSTLVSVISCTVDFVFQFSGLFITMATSHTPRMCVDTLQYLENLLVIYKNYTKSAIYISLSLL